MGPTWRRAALCGQVHDRETLEPRNSGDSIQRQVLTRLKSFLPKLANANELLSRKIENASSDDFDIENVREDTEVIEMDEDDSFTDDLSFHGLKEADETVFDKVTKTNLRLSLPSACSLKCGIVEMTEYTP
uniref:Uncharacterized protein n=1 Tax=Eptatretus burgeri TaxID=7764 RepID=A0A8C4QLD2_EPTBU